MAGIVNIFEIEIETTKAVQDLASAQVEAKKLRAEIKELSKSEADNSIEIAKKTVKLKEQQKEIRVNTKNIQDNITETRSSTGSIEQMRSQLSSVTAKWVKLSKEERNNTDEGKKLTKQKTDLTNALKKEERATGDARRNVGNYNETLSQTGGIIGGLVPGLGNATSAVSKMGTAFKVALGPIGLIVGLIGFVVASMKAFFNSSEEGQDTLRELQAVFSVVFNNLRDILAGIGKLMIKVFKDPKKAIADFAETIKEKITNRLEGLMELIPRLGKAIGLLFKGEFSESAKVAGDALAKVTLGVEDFTQKTKDARKAMVAFIAEQEKEIAIQKELSRLQNNLDKQVRTSSIQNAKDLQKIAELRSQAAQKETFSNKERLEFLDKAIKLEEKVLEKNEFIASQKLYIKKQQDALSLSTKEDLNEEARLEVDLINLRTANAKKLKSLHAERVSAIREIRKEEKAIEVEKLKEGAELSMLALDLEVWMLEEQAKEKKQIENDEVARKTINEKNKLALESENIFSSLNLQREKLKIQEKEEKEHAEKVGADVYLINQKFKKANDELDKASFDAKLSLASEFTGNIAQIAGEGTAVGKAAAIASTTIDTYVSAQKAYTTQLIPGDPSSPLRAAVAAGAAIAGGLANVKKILAVESGLPGGNKSRGGGGAGGGSVPRAPSVNQGIVSRDTIEQNDTVIESQPTLVIDDVTNAQNSATDNSNTSTI